jgi:ubiquitin C-terminal hydrolase
MESLEKYNIDDLFTYRRKNVFYCPECKTNFSEINETNNVFIVEADNEQIQNNKLDDYLFKQKNNIDENCLCSNCNIRGAKTKISKLTMIPEVLFIMAKKYKYENGHGSKLNIKVDFPEEMIFNGVNTKLVYRAVAQIEHIGGLNGGHYYAICYRKGVWYCINDNSVAVSEFNPNENTYIVVYHLI